MKTLGRSLAIETFAFVVALSGCGNSHGPAGGVTPAAATAATGSGSSVAVGSAAPPRIDDLCQRYIDKVAPLLAEEDDEPNTPASLAAAVATCRANPPPADNPFVICFLAATDIAMLRKCAGRSPPSTVVEAKRKLTGLGNNAAVYHSSNGTYVVGKTGPLPAQPCCAGKHHKCPVSVDWAKVPEWAALDFEIDEPSKYQYWYEGTATSFTATAIGDPLCDGHPVTYKVEGTVDHGNPVIKLTEPPVPPAP